jgi:exodeoxyribonuclease VII large subunit
MNEQLCHAAARRLRREHAALAKLDTRLALRHPRHMLRVCAERVAAADRELAALNPLAVLRRGYSVTMVKKTNAVVRSAEQVKGGETLVTRLAEGQIESTAQDPKQPRLFDS